MEAQNKAKELRLTFGEKAELVVKEILQLGILYKDAKTLRKWSKDFWLNVMEELKTI